VPPSALGIATTGQIEVILALQHDGVRYMPLVWSMKDIVR